jgi:putative hemolysin
VVSIWVINLQKVSELIANAVGDQKIACPERHLGLQEIVLRHGPYLARFAVSQTDIAAALRLRFEVFNLELNEGLQSA